MNFADGIREELSALAPQTPPDQVERSQQQQARAGRLQTIERILDAFRRDQGIAADMEHRRADERAERLVPTLNRDIGARGQCRLAAALWRTNENGLREPRQ